MSKRNKHAHVQPNQQKIPQTGVKKIKQKLGFNRTLAERLIETHRNFLTNQGKKVVSCTKIQIDNRDHTFFVIFTVEG